ncbi:MAG: 5-formyltetrahydrofolate cyclo-ligase [Sphingomonadaceae bacterium]|nr:5-formyltetrahydrofolate cyclo-ligase [Sphingomonadaceae bacterium]
MPLRPDTKRLIAKEKQELRDRLKKQRREHVQALPAEALALMFYRPPGPLAALTSPGATIGLYCAMKAEAPTLPYAKWYQENGYALALPYFDNRDAPMQFRRWDNPYDEDELEAGPFGIAQPRKDTQEILPDLVFTPLTGFTADGHRLGQGGGHYDRWLARHKHVIPVGLGWDCQLVDALPTEAHDRPLRMVVTPTRAFTGEA